MCTKVQVGLGKLIRPLETHISTHVTSLGGHYHRSHLLSLDLIGSYKSQIARSELTRAKR